MKLLLLCSTALLTTSTAPPQKHLVVLVHGLSGTAADLGYLARRLEADASVRVLASGANEPFPRTLDGVDAGGARVADEVRQVASAYKTISFVGNSLGGLYARAALRELRDEEKDTFAGLTPAVFVTTAAPHLGARQTQYGPLAPLLRLRRRSIARSKDVWKSTVADLSCCEDVALVSDAARLDRRPATSWSRPPRILPPSSAAGGRGELGNEDAPANGAAYLIRDLDCVTGTAGGSGLDFPTGRVRAMVVRERAGTPCSRRRRAAAGPTSRCCEAAIDARALPRRRACTDRRARRDFMVRRRLAAFFTAASSVSCGPRA